MPTTKTKMKVFINKAAENMALDETTRALAQKSAKRQNCTLNKHQFMVAGLPSSAVITSIIDHFRRTCCEQKNLLTEV
jgi:hypothetical protein